MSYDENKEFEELLENVRLSTKAYEFFKNLVNPNSDTQGEIVKSYHKAGYSKCATSKYNAYKVYNSSKFQKVLSAYRRKELEKGENREFTVLERVTQGLSSIAEKAERRGDLSVHRQALMDLAKLHGLLVERHQVIDPATELEVDKSMKMEAARIAEQRLLGHTMPVIDVECITKVSNEPEETAIESQ